MNTRVQECGFPFWVSNVRFVAVLPPQRSSEWGSQADVVPREHRSVIGRSWDRNPATSPALLDATCPGRVDPLHHRAEEAVGVVLGGGQGEVVGALEPGEDGVGRDEAEVGVSGEEGFDLVLVFLGEE